MNLLWLCRWDPRNPTDGQLLYSKGLLDGVIAAGARVTVFTCPHRATPSPRDSALDVRLFRPPAVWRGWSLLSPLQNDAFLQRSREMADAIRNAVTADVDAVVFDYFANGWALPIVRERCRVLGRSRPLIIYVSHNHEASLRRHVANEVDGSALMRPILRLDAWTAANSERA